MQIVDLACFRGKSNIRFIIGLLTEIEGETIRNWVQRDEKIQRCWRRIKMEKS